MLILPQVLAFISFVGWRVEIGPVRTVELRLRASWDRGAPAREGGCLLSEIIRGVTLAPFERTTNHWPPATDVWYQFRQTVESFGRRCLVMAPRAWNDRA